MIDEINVFLDLWPVWGKANKTNSLHSWTAYHASAVWYINRPNGGTTLLWISMIRVCYLLSFRLTGTFWLQSDWQPSGALQTSCLASYITILRHGPLPSHSTRAINTTTTPPSIPPLSAPCAPPLILVIMPTCLRKHWTSFPSWSVSHVT